MIVLRSVTKNFTLKIHVIGGCMQKAFLFLGTLFLMAGCSSINEFLYKDKCTSGNWEALGEQDGQMGRSDVAGWGSKCQTFGTKPDAAQYERGYARGAEKFCYNRAMEDGKKGNSQNITSACSTTTLKKSYEQGYTAGLGEFCTQEMGQQQGLSGQPRTEGCVKVPSYATGYNAGLGEYCTTSKAFTIGTDGGTYNAQYCSASMKTKLSAAFNKGTSMREQKSKVAQLETDIADLQKKIYDPATPADAKVHYESILATKHAQLKVMERELYKMEGTRF
jgi:hypothetical protein